MQFKNMSVLVHTHSCGQQSNEQTARCRRAPLGRMPHSRGRRPDSHEPTCGLQCGDRALSKSICTMGGAGIKKKYDVWLRVLRPERVLQLLRDIEIKIL